MYDVKAPDHLTKQKDEMKNSAIIEPKQIKNLRAVSSQKSRQKKENVSDSEENVKEYVKSKIKLKTKNGDLKIKEKADTSDIIKIKKPKKKKNKDDPKIIDEHDENDENDNQDEQITKPESSKSINISPKKSKTPSKTSNTIKSKSPELMSDLLSDDAIDDVKIEDIVEINKGLFNELNRKIDPDHDMFKTTTSFGTLNHELNFKPSNATDNFDINN